MSQGLTVSVKFGGAMVKYAPPAVPTTQSTTKAATKSANTHSVDVTANTSIQMLLDEFQIPLEQPLMIILNDAMIARPDYNSTLFSDGDALSLMPPIQAG